MVSAGELIMFVCFATTQYVTSKVTWTMLDKSVIMGTDITLYCNGTMATCRKNCTRRWSGGPEGVVLAINDISSFPTKYTPRKTDSGYYLHIRHLDRSDLNVNYTCNFGFDMFKQMLTVDVDNIAEKSPTTIDHIDSTNTPGLIPTRLDLTDTKSNRTGVIIGTATSVFVLITIVIIIFCCVKRRRHGQKRALEQNGVNTVRMNDIENAPDQEQTDLLSETTAQGEQENKDRQNGHVNTQPKSEEQEVLLSNTTEHTTQRAENSGPRQCVSNNEDQNTKQKTEDLVRCYYCAGAVHDWHMDDKPWILHARWFPMCGFLKKSKDPHFIETYKNKSTETGTSHESTECRYDNNRGAKYPEFDLKSKRLSTLNNWPGDKSIDRDIVAEAGFFYRQNSDRVYCFWCGEGIYDWNVDDDPWEEHQRWYSECKFVHSLEFRNSHENYLTPGKHHEQNGLSVSMSTTPNGVSSDETTKTTPLFPEYKQMESRLATFSDWSARNLQKPENLARAGFFVKEVESVQNHDVLDN